MWILIIGEIGLNHEGNLKEALKILKLAATSGLDAVKFQLYNIDKYQSKNDIKRYKRLNNFNLSDNDYVFLHKEAKRLGINVLATPLTEDKVKLASSFGEVIKVASGDLNFSGASNIKIGDTSNFLLQSAQTIPLPQMIKYFFW